MAGFDIGRIWPTPVEDYTHRVEAGEPFAFSRWGDGEWGAVLGRQGTNCDGHAYLPAMGEALRQVLIDRPAYRLGMQHLAVRLFGDRIQAFLDAHGLADLEWHDSDIFHYALGKPARWPAFSGWLAALRRRRVVIAGGEHLRRPLQDLLGYCRFVAVPPRNCYEALDRIVAEVLKALAGLGKPTVVCLSMSMPCEIAIDRIWKETRGRHMLIDMGAVWDPYAGVYSRGYHRNSLKAMVERGEALPR